MLTADIATNSTISSHRMLVRRLTPTDFIPAKQRDRNLEAIWKLVMRELLN